ncbi:MAG: thioredoxin family protein [Planctomycetaceae bacterium]|nr:thioredoxin family protein [Planctomycetaceae bacterium]
MTVRVMTAAWIVTVAWASWAGAQEATSSWLDSYSAAMAQARQSSRQMIVYFHQDELELAEDKLAQKLMHDEVLRPLADQNVLVRVPMSSRARVGGQEIQLVGHASFAELQGQPGLAIIDFTDPKSELYGHVISIYPLSLPDAFSRHNLQALLTLPHGSLTQRSLILAVRIHPEDPASTDGVFLTTLAQESESHSQHQARINQQGHHNWDSRFQRISARLPGGHAAKEVCAESWPGMGLIAAALDCVHSWRQSSGHWSAVRNRHPYYGYDMKRGSNGIWYATGIFGSR